jgi:hypothetical protein
MAAGNTYTQIASTTLGSAAASVTFSSIASTYTDLVLVCNGLVTSNSETPALQFNGDTGSNYSWTLLSGDGTSATSGRSTSGASLTVIPSAWSGGWSSTSNSNAIFNIQNYSNATTYKTVLSRNNNVGSRVNTSVGLWRNTAAITSIVCLATSTTFQTGATFNLYGIAAA